MNLPTKYEPKQVEEKWRKYWEEKKIFVANADSDKPKYSIVLPPPNVTGILTIGHVLNHAIQDVLIRFKKMQGYEVLLLPGTDHAGIATQNVVERKLREEGKTRFDLGREAFVKEVWKWEKEYHDRIVTQMKKLGLACDWTRERFTLDPAYARAVKHTFVKLYEKKYIYKGEYIINYCPRCKTVISNEEVEYEEENSSLWYINYPLKDGGYITVATTRPETMLGDTAIAVNPHDKRYKNYIGKVAILPIMNREIPIIADKQVDKDFGTGAVKITPAHDYNDFQIGIKHKLDRIIVIDKNGKINKNGGKYEGLDRFEARKEIVRDLTSLNLLEKIEPHIHSVGHCSRCHTTIEPYISTQWFVKMADLAAKAKKVVKEGKIKFFLPRWEKVYYHWLDNIVDWVISRQLWWGHRIPVFYCKDCGEIIVSEEDVKKCPKCGSTNIVQEEDVLDTWFSSWLWPFATMGWPDQTEDLKKFFPTDTLVTAWDIIFLWVARMIMSSLEFMDDVPFTDVYITGLVRDEKRRRFSKSLGNSPDPMNLIEKYGADGLRIGLLLITPEGKDVIYSEKSIETGRNFLNKLWNASRFILSNREEQKPGIEDIALKRIDRWIISRITNTIIEVDNALNNFRINEAVKIIYERFWFEYCDWYIEMIKPFLYSQNQESKESSLAVALWSLDNFLKLLHPFIPFITEEIYHYFYEGSSSISQTEWPYSEKTLIDKNIEGEINYLKEFVEKVRNIRGEFNIPPGKKVNVILKGKQRYVNLIEEEEIWIKQIGGIEDIKVGEHIAHSAFITMKGLEAFVPLEGIIDYEKERRRLNREVESLKSEIEKITKKMSNKKFLEKAPPQIVKKTREKEKLFKEKLGKIERILEHI